MPTEPTFDPTNSDLNIGLEVEYPRMERGDEPLADRGRETSELQSRVDGVPMRGRAVYDGTVGLEIVSDVLELDEAVGWYADVIDHIEAEYGEPFQPTGLLSSGSTAGLHIHLSELSRSQAEELYEISQTPWAKILFCSSIARSGDEVSWPVFRGGRYCRMDFGTGHYDCINHRTGGHYEWRMPEPMIPENIEILVQFLAYFEQDPEIARGYAQELLDEADDRITAIRRAEAVGMDIEGIPEVRREPAQTDPEEFYQNVENMWTAPEIYTVRHSGEEFYVFESNLDGTFNIDGIEFSPDDVLWADSLEPVHDDTLTDEVYRAYNNHGSDGTRETEATKELKKVMKKKK